MGKTGSINRGRKVYQKKWGHQGMRGKGTLSLKEREVGANFDESKKTEGA